ncbi:uncharacterized protein EV420DRAFT_1052908 [Desarmillaria tabescens]|uniref:Uncharacterized protein n=1 Tax=Armillaria tabescens TaxID=1929756 RepID=A0AA39NFD1_ARMTA|nr:uncharacterized protein EV420DRAFT_1052908 [Desarmillaria tabescens]KAK0464600.1 hypothetical protein EV420DRAFT_1052908 [Desarmillaria tabescens]
MSFLYKSLSQLFYNIHSLFHHHQESLALKPFRFLTYDGTLPRSGTFLFPSSDLLLGHRWNLWDRPRFPAVCHGPHTLSRCVQKEAIIIPCLSYSVSWNQYISRDGAENVLDTFLVIALVIGMLHSAVFHPLIALALLVCSQMLRGVESFLGSSI